MKTPQVPAMPGMSPLGIKPRAPLLILSCSETKKAPTTRRAPFADVYDGPMWRQVKSHGYPLSNVAAISALYGFLDPGDKIELYNVKMDEEHCRRIIGEGDHIHRLAEAIRKAGGAHVFGGELYKEIVRAAIRYRPELGELVTFASGSFLEQRQQLTAFLCRDSEFVICNPRNVDEKIIAERQWQKPKLAPAPQKQCDVGLFSDDANQKELF
jgi:hypothetical protein